MKTYIILLTCFSYSGNILIAIIRFARYHLLVDFNGTFITNSLYLGAIQMKTTII